MAEKEAGEKGTPLPLARLADAVCAAKTRGPAPVERWNPPYCGEIAMRVATDGTWFYEGSPIRRPALVALFASILRKDPERYVLVTPVERVGIEVEDAPFVAVAMREEETTLRFATNLGDEVVIGAEHGLRFMVEANGGVKPYVHIRGDLWARLTRSLSIDLLDRAETEMRDGTATVGVRVADRFFAIGAGKVPA